MGRRSLKALSAKELRSHVARRFQRLAGESGINLAEFEAQRHAADAVRLAWDLAQSNDAAPAFRLDCIKFVVTTAYGAPRPLFQTGETVDPDERLPGGETVGQTIEAARVTADLLARLDRLVRGNIPFQDWPEEIRTLSEAAAFAEVEQQEPEALAAE